MSQRKNWMKEEKSKTKKESKNAKENKLDVKYTENMLFF